MFIGFLIGTVITILSVTAHGQNPEAGVYSGQRKLQQDSIWSAPVNLIRDRTPEMTWPKNNLNFSKVFLTKDQYQNLTNDEKKIQLISYCESKALDYQNQVSGLVKIRNFGKFFSGMCDVISATLNKGYFPAYEQLSNFDTFLLNILDGSYKTIYYMPDKENWRASEEYLQSYKNSIFGIMGVPLKYSALVSQFLIILGLFVSSIGFFVKKDV